MSAWTLIPSLVTLRTEFNRRSPGRDKGADGSIGNSLHTSSSDHTPDEDSNVLRDHDADGKNEVHALDIDSTGPWPGTTFRRLFLDSIAGERAKWLDPDDVCRLEYAIFDRQIYSRSRDFSPVPYYGQDPHTNHAHYSARYLTASENDTRPWGVEEDEMSAAEVNEIKGAINAAVAALRTEINQVPGELLGAPIGSKSVPKRTVRNGFSDLFNHVRAWLWFAPGHPETKDLVPQSGSILDTLSKLPARLDKLEKAVADLKNTE